MSHLWTLIAYNTYATKPNPRVIYIGPSRKAVNAHRRSLRPYGGIEYVVQRVALDNNKENKNA